MQRILRTEHVRCSARQMYELVSDVGSYPDFVPWCGEARIIKSLGDKVHASLTIAKGKLAYSFSTENTLVPFERIDMALLDGPFRTLHGGWRFRERRGGCDVEFELEFEFANRVAALAFSSLFKRVAGSMVHAFGVRAATLYGG